MYDYRLASDNDFELHEHGATGPNWTLDLDTYTYDNWGTNEETFIGVGTEFNETDTADVSSKLTFEMHETVSRGQRASPTPG
jgi:hypothetical protein